MARWWSAAGAVLLLGACTPVVTQGDDQTAPATNGGLVVWEDERNQEIGDGTDVYMRNMGGSSPGPEQLLAGGRGDQTQPVVSAQYLVWVDESDINAQPRAGGATISVVRAPGDQYDPAVCGSLVVWTDLRNGNPDIYGRDLAGGGEFPVASTAATEAYPDCDGSRVVYMRTDAVTGADIALYDVVTGQRAVFALPGNALNPAISGDRVVWQAWPTQPDAVQGFDIFGLDLSGGPFVVSTALGHQTAPDIAGSLVAWEDAGIDPPDVRYRDLAGGTEGSPATTMDGQVIPRPRRAPQLSGRTIVWQEQVGASWDIYLNTVAYP